MLGDTTTQFLIQALRRAGFEYGCDLQIWEADFKQIERQVFDPGSELHQYKPELVIIFHSTHKLLGKYNKLKPEGYSNLATTQLELVENVCFSLNANLNTKIIYYNYSEIEDSVFGNYANRVESSFLFQLRKLNYELMLFATMPLDNAYMRSYSYYDTKQLNELVKNDYWQGIEDINNEQKKNIRT